VTAIKVPYLGMPGAMRALPSPRPGSTLGAPSMGDAVSTALSGTTKTFRNIYPRRTFSLNYTYLDACDAGLLLNFYEGLYGLGPFILVDSSRRNMLPVDVASCGKRSYASHGWTVSTSSLTRGSGPPEDVPDSGVLEWSSPSAGAIMQPGVTASTADPLTAAPYLSPEFCTVSAWVKAATATTTALHLGGFDSDGAFVASLSSSVSVGASWRWVSVTAGPYEAALAGSVFVAPRIVAASGVHLSVAGVQLEYADGPNPWQSGAGCPRVVFTSSPGRDLPLVARTDHTLVLAE
jgi:hypothetical protein